MPTTTANPQLDLKNILVTTDFTEASSWALEYAVELGRTRGSKLTVVHAIEPEPFSGVPLDPLHESSGATKNVATQKMARFCDNRIFHGLEHREIIRFGAVWSVISAAVADSHADLIVLATHGRKGVEHLLMGSVAEQVFRNTQCPVLTIGPNAVSRQANDIRHILYATDFSESSQRALEYASAMARENKAALTAVHVEALFVAEGLDLSSEMRFEGDKLLRDKVRPPDGVAEFHYMVRLGDAASGILEAAAEVDADLIVMGLHRHSAISSHLPWATAHQVVAHSTCPVLTLR